MKQIGCIQPSYIPWRGYFHIIQRSDVFVFHEDIQYTKQDWRNRNRVKTPNGVVWLTVPVEASTAKGHISQVRIDNSQAWQRRHWNVIERSYRQAPHFARYRSFFADVYRRRWDLLTELDIYLTEQIGAFLGIKTAFLRSPSLRIAGAKTDRLVQMCEKLGGTHYLSGPTARAYIEHEKLDAIDVVVEYQTYDYPPYPQLHGPFEPLVSIVDLLFNCGDESPEYIWGSKARAHAGRAEAEVLEP